MNKLYPLLFEPILKDKIWGGDKLKSILGKDYSPMPNCGESWEISGYNNNISVVKNGFLAGNNIEELIEIYMGDLVGDKIYEQFGLLFPLLIKFIEANDVLSIQVHPDNEMAAKHHNASGKTEMWYIVQADKGAQLISGFNEKGNKENYLKHLKNNSLEEILNYENVKQGDAFFIPPGRIHAICNGIVLAEIQQTSDLTYRIYDWNRKDDKGNSRELHTDLALEAIDFKHYKNYKTKYITKKDTGSEIISCEYFTTNILEINKAINRDLNQYDSFVIYMCLEGNTSIVFNENNDSVNITKGDTILVPAIYKNLEIIPSSESKLLEIYID